MPQAPIYAENWNDIPDMSKDEGYAQFKARLESTKEGKFLASTNGVIKEEMMATAGVLLSRKDWCLFCKTHLIDWDYDVTKNQNNKMKMFVDGCYVQFREFGEHVACMNSREKHRAATWPNNLPNPNDYLCRQRSSLPPHFRPFSLDVPEPEDVSKSDDPDFSLRKHYFPDNESDYGSSTASSNYDSYDTDLGFPNGKHRRTTPKQTSSPAMFVKSQLSDRSARPKLGDFERKPMVGGAIKRKHREFPQPAGYTTVKKPLLARPFEQNGPREHYGFAHPTQHRPAIKKSTIIKKEKNISNDRGSISNPGIRSKTAVMQLSSVSGKAKCDDRECRHQRCPNALSPPSPTVSKEKVKISSQHENHLSTARNAAETTPSTWPCDGNFLARPADSPVETGLQTRTPRGGSSLISPPREEVTNGMEMLTAPNNGDMFAPKEENLMEDVTMEPLSETNAFKVKRETTPNPLLAYLNFHEPRPAPDTTVSAFLEILAESNQNLDQLQRATTEAFSTRWYSVAVDKNREWP